MRSSMEFKYEIKFGFVKAHEWVSSKTETYFHREQAMRRYCEIETKVKAMESQLTSEQKYDLLDCATPKCFIRIYWKEGDGEWNRTISGEMQFFYEAYDRLNKKEIMDAIFSPKTTITDIIRL